MNSKILHNTEKERNTVMKGNVSRKSLLEIANTALMNLGITPERPIDEVKLIRLFAKQNPGLKPGNGDEIVVSRKRFVRWLKRNLSAILVSKNGKTIQRSNPTKEAAVAEGLRHLEDARKINSSSSTYIVLINEALKDDDYTLADLKITQDAFDQLVRDINAVIENARKDLSGLKA